MEPARPDSRTPAVIDARSSVNELSTGRAARTSKPSWSASPVWGTMNFSGESPELAERRHDDQMSSRTSARGSPPWSIVSRAERNRSGWELFVPMALLYGHHHH